jgi:hypothetical protein
MTENKQNTIKIKVEATMINLEDYFNDMIKDGFTVEEALNEIVEEELVNAKLAENLEFPTNEWVPVEMNNLGNGVHKIVLEEIDWENTERN